MKKILLFIAIATSTFSFGQKAPSFGIKAGLSSASIKGDAADNFKNLLGFTDGAISTGSRNGIYAGVYSSIPLNENFSIEPAVIYSQKGYEMRGELNLKGVDFIGANAKSILQSNYIDVPVVVKANLSGLQLFLGPQVSYLAKAELKSSAGALGFNFLKNTMNATDNLNRWDAGVTGGVGYQFTNGLNITAAYDHGLMKLDENKNMEAYNRSFKVGIGFNF